MMILNYHSPILSQFAINALVCSRHENRNVILIHILILLYSNVLIIFAIKWTFQCFTKRWLNITIDSPGEHQNVYDHRSLQAQFD